MKKIDSFSNKSIKWVKKLLTDSKDRKQQNLAVIETKKIFVTILECIENKDVEALFVTDKFFEENKKLLSKFYDRINLCRDVVFNSISNLKTPDGIICVFRPKTNKVVYDKNQNYIALYELQNPNNLGAVIRSCLAFGINNLFLIGSCCDIYHPEVIRSSMGYVFKMNIEKFNSFDYFLANAKKNGIKLLAADNDSKAVKLADYKQANNNCFIIGNEGQGIPANILKHVDSTIMIPLENNVESLNAAIATSIITFWLNLIKK